MRPFNMPKHTPNTHLCQSSTHRRLIHHRHRRHHTPKNKSLMGRERERWVKTFTFNSAYELWNFLLNDFYVDFFSTRIASFQLWLRLIFDSIRKPNKSFELFAFDFFDGSTTSFSFPFCSITHVVQVELVSRRAALSHPIWFNVDARSRRGATIIHLRCHFIASRVRAVWRKYFSLERATQSRSWAMCALERRQRWN